ncbi:Histone deacetylase HDT2 [Platanthera zijinensis]|uniref:Histone deacetylase HDT2 n=1 Tax=Platanthera zijinensis TaxID=2320716 RepID=A0AAP0ASB7_9ASPA
MEFWGVEVKPKQSVKCVAGDDKILHLSQASLGEIRKDKGSENVPVFVKVNDQKLVLGTLSAENCAQIQYDLVFEKEFELSHGSKDTSVFFVGYKSTMQDLGSEDDFSDSESDEGLQIEHQLNEKDAVKNYQEKPITGKVTAVKDNSASAKCKPQTGKPDKAEKPKADGSLKKVKDEDDDADEDDSEEESDDDEDMPLGLISSDDDDDDEDDDDDSSEDEKTKTKAENGKKRSADGLSKPSADKKAKLTTPVKQNPDVKKGSIAAAAPTAKQAGKSSASGGKAKEQSSKSTGSHKCNSCSKPFMSENALQAHTKAKHSTSK